MLLCLWKILRILLCEQGRGNLPGQPNQAPCYSLRGILGPPSYPSQQSDKMDE